MDLHDQKFSFACSPFLLPLTGEKATLEQRNSLGKATSNNSFLSKTDCSGRKAECICTVRFGDISQVRNAIWRGTRVALCKNSLHACIVESRCKREEGFKVGGRRNCWRSKWKGGQFRGSNVEGHKSSWWKLNVDWLGRELAQLLCAHNSKQLNVVSIISREIRRLHEIPIDL